MNEHYKKNKIEAIDIIDQTVRTYPARYSYYVGNTLKYLLRAPFKNNMKQDLYKAEDYLHKLRTGRWIDDE